MERRIFEELFASLDSADVGVGRCDTHAFLELTYRCDDTETYRFIRRLIQVLPLQVIVL